jgi:hypothetical protein
VEVVVVLVALEKILVAVAVEVVTLEEEVEK